MTQKEILQWAMNGVKAAWQKQNEREKACEYPKAREALHKSQMQLMQKMLELGRMIEALEKDEEKPDMFGRVYEALDGLTIRRREA
jgi:hypothetical protein